MTPPPVAVETLRPLLRLTAESAHVTAVFVAQTQNGEWYPFGLHGLSDLPAVHRLLGRLCRLAADTDETFYILPPDEHSLLADLSAATATPLLFESSAVYKVDEQTYLGLVDVDDTFNQTIVEGRLADTAYLLQTILPDSTEKRLDAAVGWRHLPQAVFVLHNEQIVFANPAAARLTGYTESNLHGADFSTLLAPSQPLLGYRPLAQLTADTPPDQPLELQILTRPGHLRWVQISAESIRYERREATLLTAVDINDYKTTLQNLARSESRFQRLLQNTSDLVLILNDNFTIRYVTPSAEQILGYKIDTLIGTDYLDHVDMVGIRSRKTGQPFDVTLAASPTVMRLRHQNGSFVYLEVIVRDFTDDEAIDGIVMNARDVTQRTEHERYIQYQASLLQNVHEAIISTDLKGRIRSWNRAARKLYGWSTDEVMGKSLFELLNLSITFEEAWSRLTTENVWQIEEEQRNKNGDTRTVQSTLSPMMDAAGEKTGLVSINRDMTERRQTESVLRLLRAATESSIDGISIADAQQDDLPLVYVNPGFTEMTGYTAEEVLGRNCRFLQGEETDQPALDELRAALRNGRECQVTLRNYRKDGRFFWNELTIYPLTDDDGRLTHFVGIQRNVTERKAAAEQLSRQARELQLLDDLGQTVARQLNLNEVLHQLVNEMLPLYEGGLAILLREGSELVFRATAGRESQQWVGRRLHIDEGVLSQVVQTQQTMRVDRPQDVRSWYLDAYGNDLHSLVAVPIRHEDETIGVIAAVSVRGESFDNAQINFIESVAGWAAIAINNARLYEALEDALEQEKRTRQQLVQSSKLAAMGRMVASVAHELNNPLQTIRNCLFLVQKRTRPQPPISDFLRMSLSEVERLSGLVSQLREVYRPSRDKQMQPVDIGKILREVRVLIAPHLKQHYVQLDWQPPAQPIWVRGMADQLKQVFLNICINGIEAMSHMETGRLSIEVEPSTADHDVHVHFKDIGSGVTAAEMETLFEPFFTTKGSGTGLGLSISYDIIQKHNGEITVKSMPKEGTTFTVRLDLLPADQRPTSNASPPA